MSTVWSALRKYGVEVLAGLVMVGAGIYLTTSNAHAKNPSTDVLVLGGALTTFGGILLSWVGSKAVAPDLPLAMSEAAQSAEAMARSEFNKQLANLSRNLGQSTGQISRAVEQAQEGHLPSPTAFALVYQAALTIYGQINEIAVLRGTPFDSAYLVETVGKLRDLAIELEKPGTTESIASVRQQLEDVRENLTTIFPVTSGVTRSYSNVEVVCPYCEFPNTVRLGDVLGDTNAATCSQCKEQFNSHRKADGSAFTRRIGEPRRYGSQIAAPNQIEISTVIQFQCQNCGARLRKPTSSRESRAVCLDCDSGMELTSTGGVKSLGHYTRTNRPIASKSGSRPVLTCPVCQRGFTAILARNNSYFAWCHDDLRILEVPVAEFGEWRKLQGQLPTESAATPTNGALAAPETQGTAQPDC